MSRFVIRGGCVVTLDPGIGTLPAGDVLVDDGVIVAVAPHIGADQADVADVADVVDATDRIVLPGFVDTHRHTWQSTLRGMLPSCTLGEYFGRVMIGTGPLITPDDVYAGTLLGAWEMLNAGITTVVDWANVTNSPEHADAGLRALDAAGIRATYAYGWPGGAPYLVHSDLPHPADARRFASEHFSAPRGLLTFALALRGPVSNPPEVLRHDWGLARELGARITVHVGMRVPGADIRDVAALDALGLLGDDTTYVHCNNCTDAELRRIADTGGTVSVSAYCESVMGHGRPPTGRLLRHGLRPSLSADVVVTVPGDMFSHMRATYASARIGSFPDDPAEPFEPELTAGDVLGFATIEGARAMGLADAIGTLTPGKRADIVLLRTDLLNATPLHDPVGTVVGQMDTANVDTVFVDGRAVKRDGALVGVDVARLRDMAAASRARVLDALAQTMAAAR